MILGIFGKLVVDESRTIFLPPLDGTSIQGCAKQFLITLAFFFGWLPGECRDWEFHCLILHIVEFVTEHGAEKLHSAVLETYGSHARIWIEFQRESFGRIEVVSISGQKLLELLLWRLLLLSSRLHLKLLILPIFFDN